MTQPSRLITALRVRYALLLVLVVALVVAAAIYAWRLRCECFGCVGIGIVWMRGTTALFTPTLLLRLVLALKRSPPTTGLRLTRG